MDNFFSWWKKEKRAVTLAKAIFLALLPPLCCVIHCAMHGKTPGQVYLPASTWNDELFYFKQVEGIIHYGYPQGFFGFNESHALKLSFAAWSPILVFPWVIWGLLFGWNLLSPIVCNICLTMVSFFLFIWLVKPSWKQTGILAFLFCLYTPYVRYMLCSMPEVICFDLLILFYGLALNYLNRERAWKLTLLFLLSAVMTLMRPYLILFLLLPMILWIRRSRWKGALGSAAVLVVVAGLYACIKHYLSAEYFAPLFFTDWVTAFFERGIFGGLRFSLGKIYYYGRDFLRAALDSFRSRQPVGGFFSGFLIILGILLFQSFSDLRLFLRNHKAGGEKPEKDESSSENTSKMLIIELHLTFCFIAMLFALLLMYKLTEGSKHLLTFITIGFFIISLMQTRFYKKAAVLGITFVYLYSYMTLEPTEYQIPFVTEERRAETEEWSTVMQSKMYLTTNNTPNFDNVVIWVFNDNVDGITINSDWQFLYGLPQGFGVSCCAPTYIKENFANIKSRYLFTLSNGEIDALCREAGYLEIHRDARAVLYDLRTAAQ